MDRLGLLIPVDCSSWSGGFRSSIVSGAAGSVEAGFCIGSSCSVEGKGMLASLGGPEVRFNLGPCFDLVVFRRFGVLGESCPMASSSAVWVSGGRSFSAVSGSVSIDSALIPEGALLAVWRKAACLVV